ncbi:MAG TPA: TolC family protein [Crocinitomix sp.]|nr:TolC family protein [Crocinitomix sp.]
MISKLMIIWGVCLGFLIKSNAQDTIVFSLQLAEDFGVEHNYNIKNTQLEIEKAQKKVWETIAIGLPQVKADGQFQNMIDIPTSVVDATLFNPLAPPGTLMEFQMGQQYNMSGTITANQLIFDGSYIVGLQFSKFYKKIAQTNADKTTAEIKVLIREAYYNVLVAHKNVDLMDSILVSTKEMWEQTKIFYNNGFVLKEKVDQMELTYNRIVQQKKSAAYQLSIAKNLLKLQMGYELSKEIVLTENLDEVLNGVLTSNPALKTLNLDDNYNYKLQSQQMELDKYALKNEKAKYLPSVGAFMTHSQNAFRGEFDFFDGDKSWYPTTVIGIGVSIPITSSGQKIMKVKQAEIKIEQDYNNLLQTEQALKFQDYQLKTSFTNAYETMLLEKKNVALAQSIYKNSLQRKNEGVIDALKVTQVQTQLLQAEGAYINAIMQVLKYKIELDKLHNK